MKIICSKCGANIITNSNEQKNCEYCGSEIIITPKKVIEGIITFEILEKDVIPIFQKYLNKKNINKDNVKILSISKAYIPYFLYEYSLNTLICGDYRPHNGFRINYLRSYSSNMKQLQCNLENSNDIGEIKLSQYDFSKIKAYDKAYIKNEYVGKLDENYEQFNNESKENLFNAINKVITGASGFKYDIEGYEFHIENLKERLILLPVYILKIQLNNCIQNFTLNGQTGKIVDVKNKKGTANLKLFLPFLIWIFVLCIVFGMSIIFYENKIANVLLVVTIILLILSFTALGVLMRKKYHKDVNEDFLDNIQLNNLKSNFYKTYRFRKNFEKIYDKKIYIEDKLVYTQLLEKIRIL